LHNLRRITRGVLGVLGHRVATDGGRRELEGAVRRALRAGLGALVLTGNDTRTRGISLIVAHLAVNGARGREHDAKDEFGLLIPGTQRGVRGPVPACYSDDRGRVVGYGGEAEGARIVTRRADDPWYPFDREHDSSERVVLRVNDHPANRASGGEHEGDPRRLPLRDAQLRAGHDSVCAVIGDDAEAP